MTGANGGLEGQRRRAAVPAWARHAQRRLIPNTLTAKTAIGMSQRRPRNWLSHGPLSAGQPPRPGRGGYVRSGR